MSRSLPSVPVVLINGLAHTGKSIVRRKVAKALGFAELDTTTIYRALAFAAVTRSAVTPTQLVQLAQRIRLSIKDGRTELYGQDVTPALRNKWVTEKVRDFRYVTELHEAIRELHHRLLVPPGVVAEGEVASRVFKTPYRFWIHATPEVRARRLCGKPADGEPQRDYPTMMRIINRLDARHKRKNGFCASKQEGDWILDGDILSKADELVEAVLSHCKTLMPKPAEALA